MIKFYFILINNLRTIYPLFKKLIEFNLCGSNTTGGGCTDAWVINQGSQPLKKTGLFSPSS